MESRYCLICRTRYLTAGDDHCCGGCSQRIWRKLNADPTDARELIRFLWLEAVDVQPGVRA